MASENSTFELLQQQANQSIEISNKAFDAMQAIRKAATRTSVDVESSGCLMEISLMAAEQPDRYDYLTSDLFLTSPEFQILCNRGILCERYKKYNKSVLEYMHNRICDQIKFNAGESLDDLMTSYVQSSTTCVMNYMTYMHDSRDVAISNLDNVAVTGTYRFSKKYSADWDISGEGQSYMSDLVTNPTWLQVAVFANQAALITRMDNQNLMGIGEPDENGVIELTMAI